MKIYVVFGKTGEYSDRLEWLVTAYTSEGDAKAHVVKATEYAKAWEALSRSEEYQELDYDERERREKAANPMDSEFSMDYTGTEYWYQPVSLQEAFVAVETAH